MNVVDFLFVAVSAVFLIMVGLVVFNRTYKPWIYNFFSGFFGILLIMLVLFALLKRGQGTTELKITNYTSKKGNLFFFKEKGCSATVWYDMPVSNNEERYLEVENPEDGYGHIVFITSADRLYSVPLPEPQSTELDIWEKDLEPANECFIQAVEAYQARQQKFSLTTGLALLALLVLYWYRRKRKKRPQAPEV